MTPTEAVKPSKVIVPPPVWYATWWNDEKKAKPAEATEPAKVVVPPPPPDTSWLAKAASGGQQEQADDAPFSALLALGKKTQQEMLARKLNKMGYTVITASSATQALERLGSSKYHLVFCSADAAFKEVRRFVNQLTADQRRGIYFVLIGADLHTLYNLEALALSANLVINDRNLSSLELILHAGLHNYEQLFRPLLDLLDSTASLR
ncbi:MAG: hypothetical protein FWD79_02025 [Desulfobulbus sp.]|nr:hypothetical protein [Desulfobulbus sp.]